LSIPLDNYPYKKNFFQGPSTSSGRGRQQQAAVHYPNPKETKVTMYKRLKRFGSWIRKTASEKDCALIVLVFLFFLFFGVIWDFNFGNFFWDFGTLILGKLIFNFGTVRARIL